MANTSIQYPFIFSDERKYRWQRHLAFWFSWWIFQTILYGFVDETNDLWKRLAFSGLSAIVFSFCHIFLAYSLMYFVLPRYVFREKYWAAFAWAFVYILISGVLAAAISYAVIPYIKDLVYGNEANSGLEMKYVSYMRNMQYFHLAMMAGLRGSMTIAGLATAIKLIKYWYKKELRNRQLLEENNKAQLQLLKAQIHPHFLFNTLNNIYSFTQQTSVPASKLVLGLGDILRYMLYETNQPLVPVRKEFEMLEKYISLESIRYGNKLDIHAEFQKVSDELYIAPLLLIPFVENSFKHGCSQLIESPWISLKIDVDDKDVLHMKLLNGKPTAEIINGKKNGIGIANARNRLDLLYPNAHTLDILNDDDVFIVSLSIKLERTAVIKTSISNMLMNLQDNLNKLSCLIVDDEPPARDIIRRYVEDLPTLQLAGECSNAIQAITFLQQQQVDLVFLDINMPQLSGVDMLKTLKNPPRVIFTTAHPEYAIEGYELDVVDYLLKPIQFERFIKSVNKIFQYTDVVAKEHTENTNNNNLPHHGNGFVYFKADRKMVKVMLDDILYVESMKDYVKIICQKHTIITRQSMISVDAMLPSKQFLRIHRCYIVAMDKIKTFTNELIEIGATEIPIGKLYRTAVMKQLNAGLSD